jgi:hypothetical protein
MHPSPVECQGEQNFSPCLCPLWLSPSSLPLPLPFLLSSPKGICCGLPVVHPRRACPERSRMGISPMPLFFRVFPAKNACQAPKRPNILRHQHSQEPKKSRPRLFRESPHQCTLNTTLQPRKSSQPPSSAAFATATRSQPSTPSPSPPTLKTSRFPGPATTITHGQLTFGNGIILLDSVDNGGDRGSESANP